MSVRPASNSDDDALQCRPPGWRGEGIAFPTRGALRITNLSLRINADGELVPSPVTAEVRADTMWEHWLAAATDACEQAEGARAEGVAAGPDLGFYRAIEREFRASMQALSSAAFAIDGFYASTVEHAPEARVQSDNRAACILETLKRAYDIRGDQQAAVGKPLSEIFTYRDRAVHPPASFAQPAPHPVYGVSMEPRFVMFRVENAQTSRRFAHQLIWYCLRMPKPRHKALVAWCEAHKDLLPEPEKQSDDP